MNQKILTASLAALVLTTGAFSVQAESTPPNFYSLNEVVVTASRTPEKKIDTNADVAVVTAKEIEQKHFDDVAQAVKNVPGVFIASHGASGQSYNSDQIYINGSSNVVVLVDGIRRNTNGNSLMNASIAELVAMDSVDHIEVLKGSSSTLYGSDAQGGVINIITKEAKEDGVKTTLRTSFGDNSKEKYTLYNAGKEGNVFWSIEGGKELGGTFKDGWGRKIINHLNAEHYNAKLGYEFGNDSDIVVNYEKYKTDYTKPSYGSNDRKAVAGKKNNDALNLQYTAKIRDNLTNLFSVYRNRTTFDIPSQPWGMDMKTTGVSDQLTYTLNKQTLTGGFDWYKDEVPFYYDNTGISEVQGTSIHNIAFYLQDKIALTNQWNITPGVRVDHHSTFGTHTSPSLSVGFKQSENTNYYVNYKTFFVAPNLYQLFGSDAYFGHVGNKNLKPQEGSTIEFGINHNFGDNLTGTFNVYHTHAKNILYADPSDNYHYANGGKSSLNGFTINLDKKFSSHWAAGIGYSYLHVPAKEGQNINFNGSLPESTLNINVDYTTTKFNVSLSGRGIMNRYGTKADWSGKPTKMSNYANYWVWDLAANYQFTKEATLFARVNNIFDQFYTDIGSSQDPYGTWYSAPGRNLEIGLQFQF
mgnify:CR=1 FL=1